MNLVDKAVSVDDLRSVPTRFVFWEVLLGIIQNPDTMNNFGLMH